jgi:hypothetical protein
MQSLQTHRFDIHSGQNRAKIVAAGCVRGFYAIAGSRANAPSIVSAATASVSVAELDPGISAQHCNHDARLVLRPRVFISCFKIPLENLLRPMVWPIRFSALNTWQVWLSIF